MTGTDPVLSPPTYSATSWDRARGWRPSRRGLVVSGLLLIALLVLMLAATPRTGYLDPGAVDPGGSRAVANLLVDQGVAVADVRTTAEATDRSAGATVLITGPSIVSAPMLDEVLDATPTRIVLIEPLPGLPVLDRLAPGIDAVADVGDDVVSPRCTAATALRAGPAVLPGTRYDARAWAASGSACYDRPEASAVVVIPPRGTRPEVVILGSGFPLTNEGLDQEGNAALATALLGSGPNLVWWRPTPTDPALATSQRSLSELLPPWVIPALIQVLLATLVVVWWRARHLGRLVVEALPVVVRAGETTAGHARLLHANNARAEAAAHLRSRAHEQIRVRLGLPLGVGHRRLVGAAAGRTGRPPEQVATLLYGPEPTTDTQLVSLGHDLEAVMREVGGV